MSKILTPFVLLVSLAMLLSGVSVNSWLIFLASTVAIAITFPRHRLCTIGFSVGLLTALWFCLRSSISDGVFYTSITSAFGFVVFFIIMLLIPRIKHALIIRLILSSLFVVLIWLSYIGFDQIPSEKGRVAYLERGNWGVTHTAERNLSIQSQYSYSIIRQMLGAEAISDLSRINDFDALWIITPTKPFSQEEINELNSWVFNGGTLVVITDHTDLFGHASVAGELLNPFGIEVGKDCVIGAHANDSRFLTTYGAFFGMTANTLGGTALPLICQFGYKERTDYGGRSFFSDNAVSEEDELGLYCVGLKKRFGRGIVKAFGDSTLFSDFALSRPSAQFCFRILRDDITAVNLPFFVLLLIVASLTAKKLPKISSALVVCVVIVVVLITIKNVFASQKSLLDQGVSKLKTSHIYGNWDWVDADGSSLGVPFATCYALCQESFPEWAPMPCHNGGVYYENVDLRDLIVEVEHIRPALIDDIIKTAPSASILDFENDLISFSYRHDVWFNNGIGVFRESAYDNFWGKANGRESKLLSLEGLAHKYKGVYYINGVKHMADEIIVNNIADGHGFCVIGDWLIGRWVDGSILVKEKWQHHLRFYGDVLFEIEKE